MEQIGLQATPQRMEIVEFIYSLFPKRELINWKDNYNRTFVYNGIENIENESIADDFTGFALQIESTESEFKTIITLYRASEQYLEERELFLALKLSEKFNCRTIINAPEFLAKGDPYYSLIIDGEKIYLADDSGTMWGDGEGNEVSIIREIELKKYDFDEYGEKI